MPLLPFEKLYLIPNNNKNIDGDTDNDNDLKTNHEINEILCTP